jgi:hypothetical protein
VGEALVSSLARTEGAYLRLASFHAGVCHRRGISLGVLAVGFLARTEAAEHTETFGIWWWSINLGHCDIPFVLHRGHRGHKPYLVETQQAASLLLRLYYGCRGNRYNITSILFATRKQALQ